MKRLISLISLFVCCFAASAQPTSIGGITPGTTSREELKSLLRESDDVGTGKYVFGGLKQLAGQWASISLQNDVVYEVDVPMDSLSDDDESAELKRALLKKYGQPKIKIGAIRTVKCQNKFGASFDRVEGKQRLLWPVKEGVQGEIEQDAVGNCSDRIFKKYVLRHVATFRAVEEASKENARREAEKLRSKLKDAL